MPSNSATPKSRRSVAAINELREKAGKKKRKVVPPEFDQPYYDEPEEKSRQQILPMRLDTKKHPKSESYALVKDIEEAIESRNSRRRRRSAR